MLDVSQAWIDANNQPLAPEQDVRFQINGSGSYYRKNCFSSFKYTQNGSIENKVIPTYEIYCELFNEMFDADVGDVIYVWFGMLVNGSWEWAKVGNFKIFNKEKKANSLTTTYTMTSSFYKSYLGFSSVGHFATDYFNGGSNREVYWSINGQPERMAFNDLAEYLTILDSHHTGSVNSCTLAPFLKKTTYGEAVQQWAVAIGRTVKNTREDIRTGYQNRYSTDGNCIDAIDVDNQPFATEIFSKVMYKLPEIEDFDPVSKIISKKYTPSASETNYDTYSIDVDAGEYKEIDFETGKYFAVEVVDPETADYKVGIRSSNHIRIVNNDSANHTFTIKAKYVVSTAEFFEYDTEQDGSPLEIDSPITPFPRTISNYDYPVNMGADYIARCSKFNQKYRIDLRIDPALELFDKVAVQISDDEIRYAIIENVEMTFNGAFNGTIHLRTGEIYEPDDSKLLCFEKTAGTGNLTFTAYGSGTRPTLEYSYDKITWTQFNGSKSIPMTTTSTKKVYVRGNAGYLNDNTAGSYTGYIIKSSGTLRYSVSGSLRSLVDKSMTMWKATSYCFYRLFDGCEGLVDAENLECDMLPNYYTFRYTFRNCTNLIKAPKELPAYELGQYGGFSGYSEMFVGCSSMITAPKLLAPKLTSWAYEKMFQGCSSLQEVPEIHAEELAYYCFENMFENCTSLKLPFFCNWLNYPAYSLVQTFKGCSNIKLSTTRIDKYVIRYRIPMDETKTATGGANSMFANTGGTFTGTPQLNTNYYLWDDDYDPDYFYIQNTTAGITDQISLVKNSTSSSVEPAFPNLEYSYDKENWTTMTTSTQISLAYNQKVYFRGNNTSVSGYTTEGSNSNYYKFKSEYGEGTLKVGGDISSLYDKSMVNKVVPSDYCFYDLLNLQCITDVSDLKLTPTTLTDYCYTHLLSSACISVLPQGIDNATILGNSCFNLFNNSNGLSPKPAFNNTFVIKAPAIPTNAFSFFVDPTNTDLTFDCRGVVEVGNGAIQLGSGGTLTIIFDSSLTTLSSSYSYAPLMKPITFNLRVEMDDNDTPQFTIENLITQMTQDKGTFIVNLYTDNTAIANMGVGKRNEYTTVNVYHLDGTSWGL